MAVRGLAIVDPDAGTTDADSVGRTITVRLSSLHGLWALGSTEGLELEARVGAAVVFSSALCGAQKSQPMAAGCVDECHLRSATLHKYRAK